MKSTTVALGLLSGLASASSYHHPRHFHQYYPRNETVADPSTTLTVAITRTQTITSCAPTVTNCPLRNNSTEPAVVTEIIDLTTTVCPATEAESISSSVVGDHSSGLITGSTSTVTETAVPVPTSAYPTAVPTTAGPGESISESTGVTEQTLTMTVGPESSRSVLITTVQSTYTAHVTVSVVPTPESDDSGSDNGNGSGNGSGSGNGGDVTSQEQTTTLYSTTTGTRTVTVAKETETASPTGSDSGSDNGSGNGSDSGECVPVTVTVTETQAASTVYVTATSPADSGVTATTTTSEVQAAETTSQATETPAPTSGSGSNEGSDDGEDAGDDEEDDCLPEDGEEEVDVPPVTEDVTATVVPVPYPTGNGTLPTYPTAVPEYK